MQELKIFKYNNNSIEFEIINGQVFANATAMCQAFGRKPVKWLELESTKRYVSALKAKSDFRTLVETRQGGLNPGTWIHEKLILKLAQWLDINFELWCDEKVSELLRTGKVELKPKTQAELFLESAQMLVAQEQRLSAVESRILQIEAQTATRPEYFTVMGYAILSGVKVSLTLAAQIGKKAKSICLIKGYHIDKIRDPRFGQVGCYPTEVLKDVFNLTSFS